MCNQFKHFKIISILFVGLLWLAVSGVPCLSQETEGVQVAEVIGSSRIYGGNMPAARELAISNALAGAVAEVALQLLPVHSQIEKFQQVNETIYEQIDDYIQDYKVLTEFMNDKNYRALVQVTVMRDKIKAQLMGSGLLVEEKRLPKILFFISEENIGDILPKYWWGEDLVFVVPAAEEAMNQILSEKGFDILQHSDISEPLGYDLTINTQDAMTIGTHRAADIIVLGSAKAEKTTNVMGGNIKSFKANVTVKAYRVDTGEEIAFSTRTAVFAGQDEQEGGRKALFEAGGLAGKDLLLQISSAWAEQDNARKQVEIVVHGTSELINFVKFRKILGKINGVNAIHIMEMKANESTIMVDYDGTAQSLAEELMLNTFESFGIDIFEVLPEKLGIELISG